MQSSIAVWDEVLQLVFPRLSNMCRVRREVVGNGGKDKPSMLQVDNNSLDVKVIKT